MRQDRRALVGVVGLAEARVALAVERALARPAERLTAHRLGLGLGVRVRFGLCFCIRISQNIHQHVQQPQ